MFSSQRFISRSNMAAVNFLSEKKRDLFSTKWHLETKKKTKKEQKRKALTSNIIKMSFSNVAYTVLLGEDGSYSSFFNMSTDVDKKQKKGIFKNFTALEVT